MQNIFDITKYKWQIQARKLWRAKLLIQAREIALEKKDRLDKAVERIDRGILYEI